MSLKKLTTRQMIFILIAIAFLLRVINVFFLADSPVFLVPTSDEAEHWKLATTLSSGDWLGRSIGPYHRPQVFAHVMAVVYAIFGRQYLLTHVLLVLIDSLAPAVWFQVARKCFSRQTAFLSALLIALYWPFVHFSATGYMETFALGLNAIFFYLLFLHSNWLWRRHQGHQGKSPFAILVAAGLCGGICALTRPTILIFMPPLGFALLYLHWKVNRSWKAIIQPAVFALTVALAMSPNAIRHWVMFDLWAPLGTGSELNFHMGNRINGWGWDVSSPGIEFEVYQNLPVIEGDVAPGIMANRQWWKDQNNKYIQEETGSFIKGLATKVLQLCNRYEIHCTQNFQYARNKSPILKILPGFGLLGPLAFAGLFLSLFRLTKPSNTTFPKRWNQLILILFIVFYTFGVALYLSIARHRLPIMPIMLIFAGWVLLEIIRTFKASNRKQLVNLTVLVIAGVIITNLPVVPKEYLKKHEQWWTQVNLGVACMHLNQPNDAVKELEKAVAIMPEKMEGWCQLALAHAKAGSMDEAVEAQRHFLMLQRKQYPEFYMIEAKIFDTMARMELGANRTEDAERTAWKLNRLVPGVPRSQLLLAHTLRANGKETEAIKQAELALKTNPNYTPALQFLESGSQ